MKIQKLLRLILAFQILNGPASLSYAGSNYTSYAELSSFQVEGKDFEILSVERDPQALIMAIPGGKIEHGTTEIAESIAGNDWSFYTFSGLKPEESDNWALHLTSTRFDEPKALSLARRSQYCISIHAYRDEGNPTVCIGGNNSGLAGKIANQLNKKNGKELKTEYPCQRFPAKKNENIVNQCIQHGAQLEISVSALDEINKNDSTYESFVNSIRSALREFASE